MSRGLGIFPKHATLSGRIFSSTSTDISATLWIDERRDGVTNRHLKSFSHRGWALGLFGTKKRAAGEGRRNILDVIDRH